MNTAFVFPGQGAQVVGMARDLVARLPAAKALFDEAASILGYDLLDVCVNGPAERLNSTAVSQPAIYVASLAALEQLRIDQPELVANCPTTAGLSLGEYSALTFAGAFSFVDGLRLVHQRGTAMQAAADASEGTMSAVLIMEQANLEPIVEAARSAGPVRIANFLCPGNLVVSGSVAAVEAVEAAVKEAGFTTKRLTVAGAFHTELMKPADETLTRALEGVAFATPRIPVWSNVDAKPHTDPAEIRALLVRQVVEPVLMESMLRGMLASGVTAMVEIGPGKVIAGLMKRIQRAVPVTNVPA